MARITLPVLLALFLASPNASAQSSAEPRAAQTGVAGLEALIRAVRPLQPEQFFCANFDEDVYRRVYEACIVEHRSPRICIPMARELACPPQVVLPTDPQGPRANPFVDIIAQGDLQIIDPGLIRQTGGCEGPRPADIGCRTMCKPCITFICVNDEWQAQRIDFPDEICNPPGPPGSGPSATACPRDPSGFCPAECSMCF